MAETIDAAAVADAVNAAAVADAVTAAVGVAAAAPIRLPPGYIMKESSSNPGYFYYYNLETGLSSWHSPVVESEESIRGDDVQQMRSMDSTEKEDPSHSHTSSVAAPSKSDAQPTDERASKRRKTSSNAPQEVRVLHILKKHKDSRRPSSWRQPKITQSLDEAKEELLGLLEILLEVESDPEELRATFEELARTESDCSSAKRGGDLGFFGRRKMQPAFEEASFGLEIGELTKELVETSSGVHVILRVG